MSFIDSLQTHFQNRKDISFEGDRLFRTLDGGEARYRISESPAGIAFSLEHLSCDTPLSLSEALFFLKELKYLQKPNSGISLQTNESLIKELIKHGTHASPHRGFLPQSLSISAINELVEVFVHLARVIRRNGVVGLDTEQGLVSNQVFRRLLQYILNGYSYEELRKFIELENAHVKTRQKDCFRIYVFLFSFFGLIAVSSYAYGFPAAAGHILLFSALFLLPMFFRSLYLQSIERTYYEMGFTAILHLHAGTNPIILHQLLSAYLPEQKALS